MVKNLKQEFIDKANKKYNYKFDYSKFDYKNSITKGIIICPYHGEFEQTPSNHLHKDKPYGCKFCGFEATSKKTQKRMQNKEINNDDWEEKLDEVIQFIKDNKKNPRSECNSKKDKKRNKEDIKNEERIGKFLITNLNNYYDQHEYFTNNEYRRNLMKEFIDKYKKYLPKLGNEGWIDNLNKTDEFMTKNNKRPSSNSKDKDEKKLGQWFGDQFKDKNQRLINKDLERKQLWNKLIEKHKDKFKNIKDNFIEKLDKFKDMLDNREEGLGKSSTPFTKEEKILVKWYHCNKNNFLNKSGIFENYPETIKIWEDFINDEKYKNKLLIGIEKNKYELEYIKKYYKKEGKLPSSKTGENKTIYLGCLCVRMTKTLKKGLIMKNQELTNLWKDFFEEVEQKKLEEYNNRILECKNNIEKIYKYCKSEDRYPSCSQEETPEGLILGNFLQNTRTYYKNKSGLMDIENEELRKLWDELEEYLKQFEGQHNLTDIKTQEKNFDEMLKFREETGEWPNQGKLGYWKEAQQSNYINNSGLMKNEKIYNRWTNEYMCNLCKRNARTNDNLCDICHIYKYPNSKKGLKRREKRKEMLVVKKLREDLPNSEFIHNKSVGNECTLQDRENTNGHLFPDIRFESVGFDLIVEVDENKHCGAAYSCDERRMYEIVKQLGLPCVFIRYNPDAKKSDYNVLLEIIKDYLEKDKSEIDFDEHSGLKIEYLFYD